MEAPSEEEVAAWAKHFKLYRSNGDIVLAGTPSMATRESYDLIPGFQLIDKNFILRSDSTGREPQDDLYTRLLPMLRQVGNEE